jgi:hypothetical protein
MHSGIEVARVGSWDVIASMLVAEYKLTIAASYYMSISISDCCFVPYVFCSLSDKYFLRTYTKVQKKVLVRQIQRRRMMNVCWMRLRRR